VIKRGQRVTVFGFKSGQIGSQVGLVGAVTAVLGDRQAPAQGIQCAVGIGVVVGEPVGEARMTARTGYGALPEMECR
jgi:hypothetical protein